MVTFADYHQKYIQVSERCSYELWWSEDYTFTHIGVYAHEFGHNLGLPEEYVNDPHGEQRLIDYTEGGGTDTYNFDLMSWGLYNGPLRKGECPATLSPYHRIKKHWIDYITLNADSNNMFVEYNYNNPNIYRINPVNALNDEHFLFESRGKEGFDKYIPDGSLNQPGNLIVWYHNVSFECPTLSYHDRSRIIPADNINSYSTQLMDFFPSSSNPGSQNFTDLTTPRTMLGIYHDILHVGNLRLAHFALNGVTNLSNGSSLILQASPNQSNSLYQNSGKWQTMSVPVNLLNVPLTSIFPTATTAYQFTNGEYQLVSSLSNGPGYWVMFPDLPQNNFFKGPVIENQSNTLSSGWNIIGTISDTIPVSNISDPSSIIISIYKYDGEYFELKDDSKLLPGSGYWVLAHSPGTITLHRFMGGLQKIDLVSEISFSNMDKFSISDAAGFSQNLYVANTDVDTAIRDFNFEMPPYFSQLPFDSRFQYNQHVKKVNSDSGLVSLNILVHTLTYPITLTWHLNPNNGINYSFIGDSGLGKSNISFNKTGKIGLEALTEGKIKLLAKASYSHGKFLRIPSDYNLEQNYPNPFNPSTTIQYDIPKTSNVKLTIFDVLGCEIKNLVNDINEPGRYTVDFDASSLPSGMYIYKITAGKYTTSKKMMLVK